MRWMTFVGLGVFAVSACTKSETQPGTGGSGAASSGGGGVATGGAAGHGQTGGAAGQGAGGVAGQGTGGSAQGGSIGTGGGQGQCTRCAAFVDACLSTGCPPLNTLCIGSIPLHSNVFSCFCPTCYSDCTYSCSHNGADTGNCTTCLQGLANGACAAAYAACQADQ